MGVENPVRDDTIECEINGETMEIGGADTFDEGTSNEAICAMTANAIQQEEIDRVNETRELQEMMNNPDFAG